MAARTGRFGKAAGWAISLGVHLLLLSLLLLAPAPRLVSFAPIEVRLIPPPDIYPSFQPSIQANPTERAAQAARAASPRPSARSTAPQPTAAPVARALAAPATAAAPAPPTQTPAARADVAAPTVKPAGPAAPPGSQTAAAVNALRQTFGCSSGMRRVLTIKEQADCEKRGAELAKDLPDRSADAIPQYKRDYYDNVVAVWNAPNHIYGTDCVLNIQLAPAAPPGVKIAPETGVVIPLKPTSCVAPPGAGPKPAEPTLKDLGLAR